jgi:hypothetical protein
MKRRPFDADLPRVILAGHRYTSTGRRFERAGPACATITVATVPRQGPGCTMDENADTKEDAVKRLHDTITQDGYRVDAAAVAEAIVRRLLAGRTL